MEDLDPTLSEQNGGMSPPSSLHPASSNAESGTPPAPLREPKGPLCERLR
jgi:hypothetical protein